jgi:hypothetical protein
LVVAGAAMNSATHVGVNGRRRKQLAPAHCGRNAISSGMIMRMMTTRTRTRITTMKKMLTMDEDEAFTITWFTSLFMEGLFTRTSPHPTPHLPELVQCKSPGVTPDTAKA